MSLWAITSYYNPARYRQRLQNFLTFRSRLQAPLIAAELAVDSEFDLKPSDADLVLHIRDGDVMWQKERLLNVAVSHLPAECTAVAWFDCDVILERADWVEAAEGGLRNAPLLQLYRDRYNLGQGIMPDGLEDVSPFALGQSLASRLEEGVPASIINEVGNVRRWSASFGLAWAARRELIERHGLYDAGILGGGDRALAGAALGQMQAVAEPWHANARQVEHYRRWAERLYQDVRARVGYIDGRLYHLWHGDREHRGYLTRYRDLQPFDFDPDRDIRPSREGAWRWNSDKPGMHAYVQAYFHTRREDG